MDSTPQPQRRAGAVTVRAVAIGLALVPVNIWWLVQIEYVRYSDSPTIPAIYFNAVALLMALLGLNALVRRCRTAWALTRGELLTIYIMVVTASNICGHDTLQILFTTISYVFSHATPVNGWDSIILPYVPRWLVVSDAGALQALYRGNGGASVYWHVWLRPLTAWTAFVTCLVWVMLCLAALVRKQWENERLNYPIAEIPLQMTGDGSLWRAPAFWWAFGIAAMLQVCVFVHTLVPAFPAPPLNVRYFQAETMPWRAAGNIPISFFPFAIGLTYLLPTQLSFSCWFFFLLSRVELVAAAAAGYTTWQGFPYLRQQQMGAYLAVCVMILLVARPYWKSVWRIAWRQTGEDAGEPMTYRTALLGGAAGTLACIAFLVAAGMEVWVATGFFILFLMTVMTVARIRAELGIPSIELYQGGADDLLRNTFGLSDFTRRDLTVMSLCFFMVRTHRQFPMQNHVDAFRMAQRSDLPQRGIAGVILATTALSCVLGFWWLLHFGYRTGLETTHFTGPALWAFGKDPWGKLESWVKMPQPRQPGYLGGYLFGALFTYLLTVLRLRFVWWPLHPLGYVISGSFALMRLWVPLFISWAVKSALLRYSGLSGYRKALPFFVGLIMGEFAVGMLVTIIDLTFNLHLPAESGIGGL